ncbi:MAG: hypothetical protein KAK00_00575 [Nanoarchaeota archaeon]|nr:hypothetical protein [Nanoarchaeota archaeon]
MLLAIIILLILRTERIESEIKTEIPGKVQYAGQEELRNFMDACIREAAFNGIEIIRLQGGYIDIPSDTPTILRKDENDEQIVTRNGIKKVVIDPNGQGNNVAYWLDSNNQLYIPTQAYVENQLADYIKESVELCVDDFNVFKNQNYDVEAGNLDVDVEFSDEILIKIVYPITFERQDIKFEEDSFIMRVPVNIKKMIDISSEIVLNEYIGTFLEGDIKYLLSLYGYFGPESGDLSNEGIIKDTLKFRKFIQKDRQESEGLPPLSFIDFNFGCDTKTWQLEEVKELLKDNFAENFRYIAVEGYGDKAPETENEIAKGVYDGFTHDVLDERYESTEIDFIYDKDNDMFVDVQPREGSTIKPDVHMVNDLRLLPDPACSIHYSFKYTLKFPVLLKINEKDAFGIDPITKTLDKDKNFKFAIPIGVFLCGNQERTCTGKPAYADEKLNIDSSILEKLNITPPVETMFCDSDMRLSQTMRFTLTDEHDSSPLSSASVFYKCGTVENECFIGVTDKEGILETRMPLCINGLLYARKAGYVGNFIPLTTYTGDLVASLRYGLEPMKELQTDFKLVDMPLFVQNYYQTQGFSSDRCTGAEASIDDQALAVSDVDDKSITVSSRSGPTTLSLFYPEQEALYLVSGSYRLAYSVMGDATFLPITVGDQTVSMNPNGGSYTGSYVFGSYEGMNLEITKDEIRSYEKIIFYLPVETTSTDIDLLKIQDIIQSDGSLSAKILADNDCDPSTLMQEIEVNITKEEVSRLLHPRLE